MLVGCWGCGKAEGIYGFRGLGSGFEVRVRRFQGN